MIDLAAFDALAEGKALDEAANQQWRVARAPVGHVRPEDFAWVETDVPEPGPGEVLLRTLYLGLAPVMRMYMQGGGAAGETPLKPGDLIHGRGVAQVAKSRHPDWREGEVVQGQLGWRTWKVSAMTPAERFSRCRNFGLPAMLHAKLLGMTGMSAWAGLRCGEPRLGDRMLLSGAAGGVGTIVSQLAAEAGCEVVGIAGGPAKCEAVLGLGCRAAVDYKADDLGQRIDAAMPDGVDLYFDNVGGETLTTALERLQMRARVVLCGSISEYARPEPFGLTNYTRLRGKEATMRSFFVYNHLDRWDEAMESLAGLVLGGGLRPVHDVERGFARMPYALAKLYAGGNVGAQLCEVRGEPEGWA